MTEVPVSIQLERFIPPECVRCETAFSVCVTAALRVIDGRTDFEQAGAEIGEIISQGCEGEFRRSGGWATTKKVCRMQESP